MRYFSQRYNFLLKHGMFAPTFLATFVFWGASLDSLSKMMFAKRELLSLPYGNCVRLNPMQFLAGQRTGNGLSERLLWLRIPIRPAFPQANRSY